MKFYSCLPLYVDPQRNWARTLWFWPCLIFSCCYLVKIFPKMLLQHCSRLDQSWQLLRTTSSSFVLSAWQSAWRHQYLRSYDVEHRLGLIFWSCCPKLIIFLRIHPFTNHPNLSEYTVFIKHPRCSSRPRLSDIASSDRMQTDEEKMVN